MAEPSYRQNPRTAGRVIGGQAFVVTPDDNKLHSLNATGTHIWAVAEAACTLTEVAAALSRRFKIDGDTARADAAHFCDELCRRGILELVP